MPDPVPPQQSKQPQSRVNVALLIIGLLVFAPGALCTLTPFVSIFSGTSGELTDELNLLLLVIFVIPSIGVMVFGAWLIYTALPRRH